MKLRNIFTALTAALALAFVGCQEEERFLDELQVSKSYVAIPIAGGQDEITVTATDKWEITNIPEWLTVTPTSGAAGETKVTFSAEAGTETLEAVLYIKIGEVQQLVNVIQMAEKVDAPITDCATVLAENNVGKVYKCKGTVTDLTNYGKYGCFYINDGTAQVYVYGSMNYAQFSPEVGDIITFEGPWTSYGNFDDVTILSLEKSLVKLEKVFPETALPLDGGVATALLTIKQGELEVVIPEDAAWLTAGEPSSLGGMTSVELTAAPNEGGARKTTVTFKVNVDGKDYFAMTDVEQLGAIAEVSVADFLAAPVGTSLYKLTGVVKNIANTTYGNFDLVDATGSVYVYGLTNAGAIGSNDKSFNTLGINEGDVVTIIGTRADYNGAAQVGGTAYLVAHVAATQSTITDFLAQAVAADKWYKLTGKVANIKSTEYGNFDLVDDNGGSVYVYGLTKAPVAKNDKSFASLGIKEGDTVTLVGTRADYKGTAQVGGPAYYISHTAAATEPETPPTGGDVVGSSVITIDSSAMPTAYPTVESEITVSGTAFGILNVANFNNPAAVQMKKSGSYIVNKSDKGKIVSIKLTYHADKSFYPDNLTLYAGTAAAPSENAITPTTDDTAKTAVYDLSASNYTYFKLTNTSTYAVYLSKVEITYAE